MLNQCTATRQHSDKAMFQAHQLHLPTDLRIFHYLTTPVVAGPTALVFDGRITPDGTVMARSYLFRQRWLELFLTFDHTLELWADPHDPFPFVCNCDLTTPYIIAGHSGYTIDLWLDILVAADGQHCVVRDQEAFDHAVATDMIPSSWAAAVRRDASWLFELCATRQLWSMLQQIASFPTHLPSQLLSRETRMTTIDAFPDLAAYPFATTVPLP